VTSQKPGIRSALPFRNAACAHSGGAASRPRLRPSRLVPVALVSILGGCFSPTLTIFPHQKSNVTVGDLVDHIACELGQEYERHSTDDIWRHLVDDNFVAQIDLTLTVTQSEGFNPSYSWIKPTLGNGAPIDPTTYAQGMTGTQATYNKTLSVGLQLNGTQDRNVEQDYSIDMRGLWESYKSAQAEIDAQGKSGPHEQDHRFPYCRPKTDNGASNFSGVHSPLQGRMALSETIADGLSSLQRSSTYNIYGSSGPTRYTDVFTPSGAPPPQRFFGLAPPSPAGGNQQPSGAASAGTSKTSFGSKVDFFITEGLNGGYAISLLKHKLAAGSGGGGGGGGSGGGGGEGL